MKKVLIMLVAMFLLCVPSVFADSAILNRQETSTNNVSISVEQNLGFVTSINCSLKLEGNVKLSKFGWASNIKENYYKRYIYNENTNTLTIYVVAPNKQNLITESKDLPLCNIEVSPAINNTEYNVVLNNKEITLVNNSYDKVVTVATENNNTMFKATKKEEKPEEKPENPGTTPGDNTGNGNNNNQSNNNQNNNANNNGNGLNYENNSNSNNVIGDPEDNEENTNIPDDITDEKIDDNDDLDFTEQEKNEQENFDKELENQKSNLDGTKIVAIVIISVGVLGIILAAILYIIRKKKNKEFRF